MAEATWVSPQVALSEAITAAKLGQLALARKLLGEIVAKDPKNERAWLWVAGLAEDRKTAYEALNRVLDINPRNQQAINALSLARLEEMAAQRNFRPAPPPQPEPAPAAHPQPPVGAVPASSWACPLCLESSAYPMRKCPCCKAILGVGAIED